MFFVSQNLLIFITKQIFFNFNHFSILSQNTHFFEFEIVFVVFFLFPIDFFIFSWSLSINIFLLSNPLTFTLSFIFSFVVFLLWKIFFYFPSDYWEWLLLFLLWAGGFTISWSKYSSFGDETPFGWQIFWIFPIIVFFSIDFDVFLLDFETIFFNVSLPKDYLLLFSKLYGSPYDLPFERYFVLFTEESEWRFFTENFKLLKSLY